jgi:hypothetical protein
MALLVATKTERTILGTKYLWKALITGNSGGDSTIRVPFGRVDGTWVGNVDEAAGYNPQIAASLTNLLTYGTAPSDGLTHWLYVLGSD